MDTGRSDCQVFLLTVRSMHSTSRFRARARAKVSRHGSVCSARKPGEAGRFDQWGPSETSLGDSDGRRRGSDIAACGRNDRDDPRLRCDRYGPGIAPAGEGRGNYARRTASLSGEVMVSAGRGYLLTGDPALLTGLTHATSRFDREGAQLTSAVDDPFAAEVAEAADRFISKQKALIARATGTRTVTFWCVDSRKSCYLCSALSRSRSIGWWSTRKTRSRKFTR